ncbi:MAG: hypothetical protein KJ922_04560, partial [Nanoarchaeota archaeon]|nr:hypothetical protein [Nanoarchaeota archaeon]
MKKIFGLLILSLVILSSAAMALNSSIVFDQNDTPPFIIAIWDKAPASDVVLSAQVTTELQHRGYKIAVGTGKLYSEINGLKLDNQVTLVIYDGKAKIIVGATSPSSHVLFATDLAKVMDGLGVGVGNLLLSSEVKYSDVSRLFDTSSCTDSDSGRDYYTAGYVQEYGITVSDYCTDSYTVKELYCDGTSRSTTYRCPDGCRDGKCLPEIGNLDFNCDGDIDFDDSEVINDLWEQGTKIDINLVTGTKCANLAQYLGDLWKAGITQIDIDMVTNIAKKVKGSETVTVNKEQVKCVFKGSETIQECYAVEPYDYDCSGKEACVNDVMGRK